MVFLRTLLAHPLVAGAAGSWAAQHQCNSQQEVETVVGDSKYGTAENLAACVEAGLRPHLGGN
jgi:hypothetical protein